MCRYLTDWLSSNWMWITERETFDDAVDAIALELRGRQIVEASFAQVIKEQEKHIPSGVDELSEPVAVIDVAPSVVHTDGIALLHLRNPIAVQTVSGETIDAKMMFFVLAKEENARREFQALIDDLLMDDEALSALANVQSRAGVYHLKQLKLEQSEMKAVANGFS